MHPLDYALFAAYLLALVGVGYYFYRRHRGGEDFFLAGRALGARHVGFSIAATDVGGGFSIGLAGLGFTMGLSASWLLFTGLLGAWLAAVWMIPKVKSREASQRFFTYPDLLRHRYGGRVAMVAAAISAIGYLGFTAAQLLAGAKLAANTLISPDFSTVEPMNLALWLIGGATILYTAFGGLKAVIYTDSVQWLILLLGLGALALPFALAEIGGLTALFVALPEGHGSLTQLAPATALNWLLTITPIWLVAMTLYQRIYACRDIRTAKRAWYLAGFLEYPLMAFSGVLLGMCARVLLPEADAESAVPIMIRDVLPLGLTGIVIAAYFSAIMSTADSCLMASSGNLLNDLLGIRDDSPRTVRLSMLFTLSLGLVAILLASKATSVLDAILMAYGLMVSGLVAPTLACLFWPRIQAGAAMAAMLVGCVTVTLLMLQWVSLPEPLQRWGLEPSVYGLALSLLTLGLAHRLSLFRRTDVVEVME
ncbi:sodium:solute symporter family protein [Ferrimonas marina]|uniref:Solute:Na+ symporter, SSS family n=1 Tax=Ferrimonas marina TaxID=299255 RepID=A0A1M5S1I5_9GAMM|nr:sodium:solute symporter family protein [Ferrimonas marina]SHH32437.1 solute:Na+ symporter, SSS family [Ferrimonas marina]